MAIVPFPALKPSSRSYQPGEFPTREFVGLNGATTQLRYSSRRSNSELSLEFQNVADSQAVAVLASYEAVTRSGDWLEFTTANAMAGAAVELQPWLAESNSGLRWRYAGAPKVTSVFPGRCNLSCSFVGQLDG